MCEGFLAINRFVQPNQPCVDYRTYTRCEEFDATEAIWVEESHLRSFIIGLIP